MRFCLGCGVSAFVGAIIALALQNGSVLRPVDAQERSGERVTRASFSLDENRSYAPTNLPALFNREGLTPEEAINVAVYEAINKSVVNINTKSTHSALLAFEVTNEGTGSGSILDKAGHIVTNYHVIAEANDVIVTLHDGKQYDASFIGADQKTMLPSFV